MLPHEAAEGSSFILVDIYENLWAAPEVFLKWWQAVDAGNMKEPEKSALCYCITRIGNEFHLYCSPRKDSLQSVKHPLPPPYSPLPKANGDDEEEEEDAFPADDNNEESDSDFIPDKK